MSLDLKLATIYYALAGAVLVVLLLLIGMRFIINHTFASSGYKFYVMATHEQPQCETCPFNKRCPYSNGEVCRFTKFPR